MNLTTHFCPHRVAEKSLTQSVQDDLFRIPEEVRAGKIPGIISCTLLL